MSQSPSVTTRADGAPRVGSPAPGERSVAVTLRRQRVRQHLVAQRHRRWRIGRLDPDGADDAKPARPQRRWSSRQLHRLGAVASHAWAGVVVLIVAMSWVIYGIGAGFPSYWQAILQSVTSVLTVVMLFAIQHLQARDQTVIQRKLDEILRVLPGADHQLIAVEAAPDEELEALTDLNHQDRLR